MTTAIAAVPALPKTGSADMPKTGGLSVELAKSESELADWVYCASSKTPEGKHKIEQLTQHIDQIKAQMEHAERAPTVAVVNRTSPSAGNAFVTTGAFVDLIA